MCQFTSLLTEHFDLNKDDGHIRLLIMNNKSSCQRRRILPSVHSTDAVPYFSSHQVLFRTCPSRTAYLAKKSFLQRVRKLHHRNWSCCPAYSSETLRLFWTLFLQVTALKNAKQAETEDKMEGKCAWKLNNTNTGTNPLISKLHKASL